MMPPAWNAIKPGARFRHVLQSDYPNTAPVEIVRVYDDGCYCRVVWRWVNDSHGVLHDTTEATFENGLRFPP